MQSSASARATPPGALPRQAQRWPRRAMSSAMAFISTCSVMRSPVKSATRVRSARRRRGFAGRLISQPKVGPWRSFPRVTRGSTAWRHSSSSSSIARPSPNGRPRSCKSAPASQRCRPPPLGRARLTEAANTLLRHFPAQTPVFVGRNLGRDEEERHIIALSELAGADIDMLTVVLVGSSRTRRLDGDRPYLYTPRGYFDSAPHGTSPSAEGR